jgi:hypothetical protein
LQLTLAVVCAGPSLLSHVCDQLCRSVAFSWIRLVLCGSERRGCS